MICGQNLNDNDVYEISFLTITMMIVLYCGIDDYDYVIDEYDPFEYHHYHHMTIMDLSDQ